VFTIGRNRCSPSTGMAVHDGPEYAITRKQVRQIDASAQEGARLRSPGGVIRTGSRNHCRTRRRSRGNAADHCCRATPQSRSFRRVDTLRWCGRSHIDTHLHTRWSTPRRGRSSRVDQGLTRLLQSNTSAAHSRGSRASTGLRCSASGAPLRPIRRAPALSHIHIASQLVTHRLRARVTVGMRDDRRARLVLLAEHLAAARTIPRVTVSVVRLQAHTRGSFGTRCAKPCAARTD
jgi:hypothetical protein